MFRNRSLKAKLISSFAAMIALTGIIGGVTYWGVIRLGNESVIVHERLSGELVAADVIHYSQQQYRAQADLTINRDMEHVKEFDVYESNLKKSVEELSTVIDTQEEKQWLASLEEADSEFDALFKEKVLPEVEHEMKEMIQKLDHQTDALVAQMEKTADDLLNSNLAQLEQMMQSSTESDLAKLVQELLAFQRVEVLILELYQLQADLIINHKVESIQEFETTSQTITSALAQSESSCDLDTERQMIKELQSLHGQMQKQFKDAVVPEVTRVIENRLAKYDDESDGFLGKIEVAAQDIKGSLQKEAEDAKVRFAALQSRVVGIVVTLAVVVAIAGLILALMLTRSIVGPISRVIDGLKDGASQTTTAAEQIASSSQQLAEGAAEQASSLEETSSSLQEVSSSTQENSASAQNANRMMTEAKGHVDKGALAVKNMASAMGEISTASERTGKIIKTIEEIAFQTNLLALNAAVEAARAGTAGGGFAVVADEVRSLAQRSGQAARDTADLIEGTVARVKNGTSLVEDMEKAFKEIEQSSSKVASIVGEISVASNQQAKGVEQVNTAVSQMNQTVQQNSANAEESASAAEELSAQAQGLNQMVSELVIVVGGSMAENGSSTYSQGPARRAPGRGQRATAHLPLHGLHHESGKGNGNGHAGSPERAETRNARSRTAEAVIPLEDDDMKDF